MNKSKHYPFYPGIVQAELDYNGYCTTMRRHCVLFHRNFRSVDRSILHQLPLSFILLFFVSSPSIIRIFIFIILLMQRRNSFKLCGFHTKIELRVGEFRNIKKRVWIYEKVGTYSCVVLCWNTRCHFTSFSSLWFSFDFLFLDSKRLDKNKLIELQPLFKDSQTVVHRWINS